MRYGIAIFLGAFLLFHVQPLLGQALLPRFGGTYMVWTLCLVFFQVALLGGYAYAHGLVRLAPRRQALIHGFLLLASLVFLPITSLRAVWSAGPPALQVLWLLLVQVGLPYTMLAATAPLLQTWFHRETQAAPYRFYALSNAASLLGLFTYPFLVQPFLATRDQDLLWSGGYGLFVLTLGLSSWTVYRKGKAISAAPRGTSESTGSSARSSPVALWVALPAAATMLLLGITNELTSEVAAVPFLWVIPLGLYLLSFILAFDRPEWYSRRILLPVFLVCLLANTPLIDALYLRWATLLPVANATLFFGAWICHGELVRLRPHPARLTGYYLSMAAGGAMGGVLVGVLAPVVFNVYWEIPLGLTTILVLLLAAAGMDPGSRLHRGRRTLFRAGAIAGTAVLGLALFAVPLINLATIDAEARNFYGVVSVSTVGEGTPDAYRVLMHGTTLHGIQFTDPSRSGMPTTYYGPGSGVAAALEQHPARREGEPLRIGAVGLGVGVIAAWGRPGDVFRFYELNPAVVDFARSRFTFLSSSPASSEFVVGDGRIALEHDPPGSTGFDVLVLDAFSGGSIPVHLLTLESFELYERALRPGGILAVHVSNEFLRLAPAVRAAAAALGLEAVLVMQYGEPELGLEANQWVLVTGNRGFLEGIRESITPWSAEEDPILLTDQRLSYLRLAKVP